MPRYFAAKTSSKKVPLTPSPSRDDTRTHRLQNVLRPCLMSLATLCPSGVHVSRDPREESHCAQLRDAISAAQRLPNSSAPVFFAQRLA